MPLLFQIWENFASYIIITTMCIAHYPIYNHYTYREEQIWYNQRFELFPWKIRKILFGRKCNSGKNEKQRHMKRIKIIAKFFIEPIMTKHDHKNTNCFCSINPQYPFSIIRIAPYRHSNRIIRFLKLPCGQTRQLGINPYPSNIQLFTPPHPIGR